MSDELQSPAIIGKTLSSQAFKGRDVMADIRSMGFEPAVTQSLMRLADEQVGVRQTLGELAGIVDQLISRMTETMHINESLVKQIDALRSRDAKYEESKDG